MVLLGVFELYNSIKYSFFGISCHRTENISLLGQLIIDHSRHMEAAHAAYAQNQELKNQLNANIITTKGAALNVETLFNELFATINNNPNTRVCDTNIKTTIINI